MTLKQALLTADKQTIDGVSGRISKVNKPMSPTEKQAQYGIHIQEIELTDDAGASVTVQIMSKDMHLTPTAKNNNVTISSTSDGSKISGLAMSIYNGAKKLTLSKYGELVLTGAATPPAASADRPSAGKPNPPRGAASDPWPEPTIEDLTDTFTKIMFGVAADVGANLKECAASYPDLGEECGTRLAIATLENARAITTTIFIEACKRGLIKPSAQPASQPQQVEAPKAETEEVSKATSEQVLRRIADDAHKGTIDIDRADKALSSRGLTWEQVYDIIVVPLFAVHGRELVDSAYDSMRAAMATSGGLDNETFCRNVVTGWDTFVEEVQAAALKKEAPFQTDDIPY